MSFQQLTESFDQQITDQDVQVEALKSALKKLELKLSEARGKADLLIAQHRRSRAVSRAADAQLTPTGENRTFERMRTKVAREEALGRAKGEVLGDDIDGRLDALEREDKINCASGGNQGEKTAERLADLVSGAPRRAPKKASSAEIPSQSTSGAACLPTCSPFVIC